MRRVAWVKVLVMAAVAAPYASAGRAAAQLTTVPFPDVDHDGFGDLAVGVPGEDLGTAADAGAVVILFGSATGLGGGGGRLITQGSPEPGDRFGFSLTQGEVTALDQLVVGAPGEDVGAATDAGAVSLITSPGSSPSEQLLYQGADVMVGTPERSDAFGSALAAGATGEPATAGPPVPRSRRRLAGWIGAAAVLAVLMVLAGQLVGGTPDGGTAGSPVRAGAGPPASGPAVKPLPSRFQASGTIRVSSQGSLAPMGFMEPGSRRFRGLNVDLAEAMGRRLRVRFEFRNVPFTHSFRDMRAGRSDIAMSVFRDINRAPDLDYVHYLDPSTTFVVPRGNPSRIRSRADLCGRIVARSLVTPEEALLRQSRRCLAAGKEEVTVVTTAAEQPLRRVLEVVRGRRADIAMLDLPLAEHALGTSDIGRHLEAIALDVDAGPYGLVVRKADGQLRDALQSALQAVIDDGTYARILARWDLSARAVPTASVNGQTGEGPD